VVFVEAQLRPIWIVAVANEGFNITCDSKNNWIKIIIPQDWLSKKCEDFKKECLDKNQQDLLSEAPEDFKKDLLDEHQQIKQSIKNLVTSFFIALKVIVGSKLLIYIPVHLSDNKFTSSGMSAFFNNNLCDQKIKLFCTYAIIFFTKTYIEQQEQIIKSHAIRSAVAAIMARNMSHNIGSHVLNYLSNPEELDNLWVI
ncbi:MAG: hypothetical protein ACUVQ3_03570, partial [bacterium]